MMPFHQIAEAKGCSKQEAISVSIAAQNLAKDLAWAVCATEAETLFAVRALLLGEKEPIRRYGIRLAAADLNGLTPMQILDVARAASPLAWMSD